MFILKSNRVADVLKRVFANKFKSQVVVLEDREDNVVDDNDDESGDSIVTYLLIAAVVILIATAVFALYNINTYPN